MRSLSLVLASVLSLLLLTEVILATPILLDKLFGFAAYQPSYSGGGYGGNQHGYYGTGGGGYHSGPTSKRKPQGRSYKDICRVVNPTQYALPGSVSYPAAPFCPY
ncbi:uncharacterized protein LOC129717754 [Wyeomyia smithii]|uniref:uncharacterized protein LOC129717754 n=1 Tax=Wyeomyia smithii TaxID=174621 RepID=UPI002467FA98|nr:uncharacterized protein LOC129717754 [Wyeomyia smithii]XP_055523859.1 uncharacterized protein LOC129717754 [Wyeomyia smithii]XP_055523860.1 uncharacterized protein LOC129717754 [Wyeomyia smithii]